MRNKMLLYRMERLIEMMDRRKRILFEENEEGYEWVAQYYLGHEDIDDFNDENNIVEISLTAPDFDTAAKYAQQYLRKMKTEEETAQEWAQAEVLAVQLY